MTHFRQIQHDKSMRFKEQEACFQTTKHSILQRKRIAFTVTEKQATTRSKSLYRQTFVRATS